MSGTLRSSLNAGKNAEMLGRRPGDVTVRVT
jgi:hypothetical protein